ncbi:MAG: hypothetical protein OK455_06880 [Thaumarchaeota archaeon]|nr:hypothetical protein [Nitrososphaerota archaeon]
MPDSITAVAIALAVVDAVLFIYGAYWAFAIRRAFAAPIYRRQASWVGAIGAYFGVFFLLVVVLTALGVKSLNENTPVGAGGAAFIYVGVVMFFVWIDSTMRVSRRSDPLLRNTLHWSTLRWFLGFLTIVGTLFAVIFNGGFALAFFRDSPLYGPVGAVLLLGAIALIRSASRSADAVLRRHLKWFGMFSIFLWATSTTVSELASHDLVGDPELLQVFSLIVFALSAYFLYRSAKSLAPMAHLPALGDESASGTSA